MQDPLLSPKTVARIGGEEFLLILRGVDTKALTAMERLAEWWRAGEATTWSAGIAVNRPGEAPAETLARAEAALYEAKAGGRDLVVLSPDPSRETEESLVEA